MTSKEIIQKLKSFSSPKNIEGMKKFACGGAKTLGVSIPVLRKMAKSINHKYTNHTNHTNKNSSHSGLSGILPPIPILDSSRRQNDSAKHQLAQELWESGYHEARILASMIDEPSLVTTKQMDSWIADFDSWDVCDQVCMNLFAKLAERSPSDLRRPKPTTVGKGRSPEGRRGNKTPDPYKMAIKWSSRKPTFQKRAGFALMAVLAWKDKKASDDKLKQFFPIIIREAADDRNFVKKAINWALRQIGKSRPSLRQPAIDTAQKILKKYPNSKSARWIANDAIRELSSRS